MLDAELAAQKRGHGKRKDVLKCWYYSPDSEGLLWAGRDLTAYLIKCPQFKHKETKAHQIEMILWWFHNKYVAKKWQEASPCIAS